MMWSWFIQLPPPIIGLVGLISGLSILAVLLWFTPSILRCFGIDLTGYKQTEGQLCKWSIGLMREQSTNSRHYINVILDNINLRHLNDSNPYIDFTFTIHNCSIFILFVGIPTYVGHIMYHDLDGEEYSQFKDAPEIPDGFKFNTSDNRLRFVPNQRLQFGIRQWLTSETASEISKAKEVRYYFHYVDIPLELKADAITVDTQKLRLPHNESDEPFRG